MSIAEDFVTKLKTVSAITALVGSGSSARIHRNFVPTRATLPYIVFGRSHNQSDMCLSGPGGLEETHLAVECRSSTPAGAEALSELVKAACDGATGTWGSSTIRGAFVRDIDDDFKYFPPGNDAGEHTVAKTIAIHHVV